MADWNTIRESVTRAADKAAKATGSLADTASLYVRVKTTEAKLDGYYTALGKLTYKQLNTGEAQTEKIAETIRCIDEERTKLKDLRNRIEIEKAKRRAGADSAEKIEEAVAACRKTAEAESTADGTESAE